MFKLDASDLWKKEVYRTYGKFGDRLLALVIDFIVFIPFVIVFSGMSWLFNITLPSEFFSVLFILYIIVYHWKAGASIGKRQIGLRVENIKGEKISISQSVIRQVFPILIIILTTFLEQYNSLSITKTYQSEIGTINLTHFIGWQFYLFIFLFVVTILDVLWIFTNNEKRALHDIIAKTYCKSK